MMEHRYPAVIGRDLAGVVEAVGANVIGVAVGDEVFGFVPAMPPLEHGAWAERVSASSLVLAPKPLSVDWTTAAALPLAGSAALDLLDAVAATAGDTLLIVGATGGVGTLTIQLAARRGVTVVATARPEEAALVRDLGATGTIDHTAGSVADAVRALHPEGVDALIDLVDQADGLAALASVVRDGGHIGSLLNAADAAASAARRITAVNVMATPTPDKLRTLAELVSSGALQVIVQDVYPLDKVGEAVAAFQRGTRGKIVLRIS